MIKSYFFLSRLASELSSRIKGKTIIDIYTSKKDTLFLNLYDGQDFTLEICVNHSLPYIQILESANRKKRNSLDIFPEIKNLKFSDVFIAKNDRIILFQIENEISIFFTIRGKFTNMYLLNNDNLFSFKKISNEELEIIKSEFLSLDFVKPLSMPEFTEEDYLLNILELRNRYPIISKEIIDSVSNDEKINLDSIVSNIKKIYFNNFYLINDYQSRTTEINFSIPDNSKSNQIEEYESALEASKKYLNMLKYFDELNKFYSSTKKQIEKELNYLNNKKKNIQTRLELGSKENEYRKIAELLLINKSLLHTGLNEIILNNIYDNNKPISIQLNKKFNPQENIEYYFNKAKDEKIFFERSSKILSDIEKRMINLENASRELENCKSLDSILLIRKNIGIKMKNSGEQTDTKLKFRHFLIENKYNVYVGKDSKSNDHLTLKFAKQNDYWFHARSVSGSHVVLRVDNKNEAIPKSILKKAASIAAFYSKAKSSSLVNVSYTQKKYVVKKKGMDIGQVALLKENTLLVKPEIPEDAIIVEQE